SWKRLETLEGVLNEGDKVKVKLTGTDPKTGKFKLSRKILLPKPEGQQGGGEREGRENRERPKLERNQGGGNGQRREQRPLENPEQENQ
ncbi:MAG TPA: polyribonucleotide nucleotidyltransferase, partial [Flavisolibacter sp.]|nr:polyribonucleotide nucleotidyltransferase [Flavisolibacter sp.]